MPLRLFDPVNEPILAIRVLRGKRVIYRYDYPGNLRKALRVALPRRASRVTVMVRTTSNKRFNIVRRFGPCGVRRANR